MKKRLYALGLCMSISFVSCGKYSVPIPPERIGPRAVSFLPGDFAATDDSVLLTWQAPDQDLRAERLKQLDGYRIYRKALPTTRKELLTGDLEEFELRAVVLDDSIERLNQEVIEARKKDLPGRGVSLSSDERLNRFIDRDLTRGTVYLYKIEPFNRVGVRGGIKSFLEVFFDGKDTKFQLLANEADAGKLLASNRQEVTIEEITEAAEEESSSNALGL